MDGRRIPVATHGSSDKPLRIGKVEIQCYVLAMEHACCRKLAFRQHSESIARQMFVAKKGKSICL